MVRPSASGPDDPTERGAPGSAAGPRASEETEGASPGVASAASPPPTRLGGYELLEAIGSGATGFVYRARHEALGKLVALKVLHPGGSADEVARFLHEARAMAELSHPNIVPVHDIGQAGASWFLAMDLVQGGTLASLIRERRAARESRPGATAGTCVPLDRALGLLEKIARAVAHAHERGIIHRDLKPSNVLLRSEDDPLVADFGIARHIEDWPGEGKPLPEPLRLMAPATHALTRTGQFLGTPAYMAPEQAEGASRAGAPADVYALGSILHEMLTGDPPREPSGSIAQDLVRIVSEDPPPPSRRVPTLPRDVETIVLTAMAREPGRRYASAADLAEDIRRFREGAGIRARRPTLLERAARFARRRRAAIASGLLGALATAALAVGLAEMRAREAARPPAWETVYEARFDSPSDIAAWRVATGTWRVEGGALTAEAPADAEISLPVYVSGDVRVSYTATLEPRDGAAGDLSVTLVAADAHDAEKDEDGYFYGFGANSNTSSKIMRGPARLAIAEGKDALIVPGRAHRVTAERIGGALRLEVDGRTVLAHEDLFPLSFSRGARVALYVWEGRARFDAVKVERRALREPAARGEFADWVRAKGDHAAAARLYAELAGDAALAPRERDEARLKEGLSLVEAAVGVAATPAERGERATRARAALDAAAGSADPEIAARARLGAAEMALREGRVEDALAVARAVAERAGDPAAREAVKDLLDRGDALLEAKGDAAARAAWLRGSLALTPGEPTRLVEARVVEARLLSDGGRAAEAAALLEGALPQAAGQPYLATRLLSVEGVTLARGGDLAAARAAFARAVEAAGANGYARLEALLSRASTEIEVGDPRLAREATQAARALSASRSTGEGFAVAVLDEIAGLSLPDGEPVEARAGHLARLDALALDGLGEARVDPVRQEYAVLAALHAAVDRLSRGREEEARLHLARATLWRTAGVYDEAAAWVVAASLEWRAGDATAARAHLRRVGSSRCRWPGLRALANALARGAPREEAEALLPRAGGRWERATACLALGAEAAARGDVAAARARYDEAAADPGGPRWLVEAARRLRP